MLPLSRLLGGKCEFPPSAPGQIDNPSKGQVAASPRDATSSFFIFAPYPACYNYEISFIFFLCQGRATTPSEKKILSLLQRARVPGCIPLFPTLQTFYTIFSLLLVFPQRALPLFPSLCLLPTSLVAWALTPMYSREQNLSLGL